MMMDLLIHCLTVDHRVEDQFHAKPECRGSQFSNCKLPLLERLSQRLHGQPFVQKWKLLAVGSIVFVAVGVPNVDVIAAIVSNGHLLKLDLEQVQRCTQRLGMNWMVYFVTELTATAVEFGTLKELKCMKGRNPWQVQ